MDLITANPWHSRRVPVVAPVSLTDPLAVERDEALDAPENVQVYRDYAKGHQSLVLSDEQRATLDGILDHEFCDNVYDQILRINADRLKVVDFDVTPPKGMDPESEEAQRIVAEVKAWVAEFVVKAHFDKEQNKTNKSVVRDGNHTNGLAWDEDSQRVLLFQEKWWDANTGMYVAYGDNGLPLCAIKEWIGPDRDENPDYRGQRGVLQKFVDTVRGIFTPTITGQPKLYRWRTVYHPDRIEPYRKAEGEGEWEIVPRFMADDESENGSREVWPIPWLKRDGSPLGIPVVHFAVGGDDIYGEPVAPMPVVANQDFLNDVRYDLAACGRQTGFQRTVFWGFPAYRKKQDGSTNPDGTPQNDYTQPIPYATGAGYVYVTEDPGGGASVLEAGDPESLIKIYDKILESMSRQTQTPFFLLTLGANSSGAAILRAEAPLANKAKEQTESLGPSYATLIHRAIEIYNAKNRDGITINEDAMITPRWADTSKPDEMAVMEYDKAKADLERAQMILEQERKAIEEGRPIYLAPDDSARRLAAVTIPLEEQAAAA